jgi:hypothetical protein
MNRRRPWIISFLALATLAAPSALRASPAPGHVPQQGPPQRDPQGRIWDSSHRDWHAWDDREERAYRAFLVETLRDYRSFDRLADREQIEYWNWRHGHSDEMLDRMEAQRGGNPGGNPGGPPQGRRYYDNNAREWHDWNDNEERAYRAFLAETRRDYIEFGRLDERTQGEYWFWRRNHPDQGQGNPGPRPPGRFYDNNARAWHDWNDNEDRAYRAFLAETRRDYIEFGRVDERTQSEYWMWRSNHPDQDNRGGNPGNPGGGPQGRRYYDRNSGQWHDWNDDEDRAYRRYLEENRRVYIDFDRADIGLQLQFWLWRQSHPDAGRGARRYYDSDRREWHDWNDNEDRAYRRFIQENNQAYIDFDRADNNLQVRFWIWRRSHPDVVGPGQGQLRYYDSSRREWHDWNDREEAAYRDYLRETRRNYVDFSVLSPRIQIQFWTWRRFHPDADERGFRRYYDPGHNDWHVWDDNEERAYREFMRGRNWPYRELSILNPKDQQRYWDWRHQHPDAGRR